MSFKRKEDLKDNAIPTGKVNHLSRREFMEDLPDKVKNIVRGIDIALINEATSAIAEGRATINGKTPKTRIERYIVIASYFKTARTNMHMFFEGATDVKLNYVVDIKHHDQAHTIKFPGNISES